MPRKGKSTHKGKSPATRAKLSHEERSLISRKTDEALRAKKVPNSEGGLRKWRGNRNRSDFPSVDTVHRKKKAPAKQKPKKKDKGSSKLSNKAIEKKMVAIANKDIRDLTAADVKEIKSLGVDVRGRPDMSAAKKKGTHRIEQYVENRYKEWKQLERNKAKSMKELKDPAYPDRVRVGKAVALLNDGEGTTTVEIMKATGLSKDRVRSAIEVQVVGGNFTYSGGRVKRV